MNRSLKFALCALAISASTQALAAPVLNGEADEVLIRNQTLESMEFKRDQLKIQAEMATSYKQMTDAGLLVDEKGEPLGVKSFQELAIDVRKRAEAAPAANPFAMNGQLPGTATPFTFDQPSGAPSASQQQPLGPVQASGSVEVPNRLELVQVNADSIVVRTGHGERVLRIGDKVNDLALTRFDANRAYLKGPSGTEVISIDWARSKR